MAQDYLRHYRKPTRLALRGGEVAARLVGRAFNAADKVISAFDQQGMHGVGTSPGAKPRQD
jgi:hypothetical protein